jgi:hypothetical protein
MGDHCDIELGEKQHHHADVYIDGHAIEIPEDKTHTLRAITGSITAEISCHRTIIVGPGIEIETTAGSVTAPWEHGSDLEQTTSPSAWAQ